MNDEKVNVVTDSQSGKQIFTSSLSVNQREQNLNRLQIVAINSAVQKITTEPPKFATLIAKVHVNAALISGSDKQAV